MKSAKKIHIKTLLIATLLTCQCLHAEDLTIPVITKPIALEEGIQRELTPAQINELLPWAKDSKVFLLDLLENIQNLSMADKVDRLQEGLRNLVDESASKHSELLMRYALNRGLVIAEILDKETIADSVGVVDAKLRILRQSILMAIKYYDTDMEILAKKSVAPYVLFGLDYYTFLVELNKSIFDASAQYKIQRSALEWLQWDMYRDLNNISYASQIVKINNGLKVFPNRSITDAQAISFLKQMKSLSSQLRIKETLEKLELEKRLAIAQSEEEKRKILETIELEKTRINEEKENEERKKNGLPDKNIAIQKNDVVISGTTLRVVEYVSQDGRAVLMENNSYYQNTVSLSSLEKTIPRYKDISESTIVLADNKVRVVEKVGHKGTIVLQENSSYYRSFYDYSKLSVTTNQINGLSVGDKVLYKNTLRVIEYLAKDGRAVLKENNSYYQTYTTTSELSKVN